MAGGYSLERTVTRAASARATKMRLVVRFAAISNVGTAIIGVADETVAIPPPVPEHGYHVAGHDLISFGLEVSLAGICAYSAVTRSFHRWRPLEP